VFYGLIGHDTLRKAFARTRLPTHPTLQGQIDVSSTFQGPSLDATVCFLRMVYLHGQAHADNLEVLASANLLPGVLALAHKLNAAELLGKAVDFLEGGLSWVPDRSCFNFMPRLSAVLYAPE
jgi:hypothetical protein